MDWAGLGFAVLGFFIGLVVRRVSSDGRSLAELEHDDRRMRILLRAHREIELAARAVVAETPTRLRDVARLQTALAAMDETLALARELEDARAG